MNPNNDTLGNVNTVIQALSTAVNLKASDIHIAEGTPPWIRHGGTFAPIQNLNAITKEEAHIIVNEWGDGTDTSETVIIDEHRWRLTCYEAADGLRASFRRIPSHPPSLEQLSLPFEINQLLDYADGLIIAAGATGAGKTTTLASFINRINQTRNVHILTIEDPIEYLYPAGYSMISQRNVPIEEQHTALKTALRSDPDIVFLGECRLAQHFELCLTLAATGHLVLTSVHARDASSTCQRIATATGDTGRSALAQTLRAVITQRLIPDANERKKRHLVVELMLSNPATQQAIRPGGDLGAIQRMLRDEHKGMDQMLAKLTLDGHITIHDASSEALDLDHFNYLLNNIAHPSRQNNGEDHQDPLNVQQYESLAQLGR